jgi:type IV pilus assembly protein PilF
MFLKNTCPLLFSLFLLGCSSTPVTQSTTGPAAAATINAKLALAYLANGDVERAKQKILVAQQQAPSDPVIWGATGYFEERTGDASAARIAYQHALQLAPKLGEAHNNYGAFLCRQGEYRAAVDQFLIAVTDPQYLQVAAAYQNASKCAAKIPDPKLAAEYAQLAKARAGQ